MSTMISSGRTNWDTVISNHNLDSETEELFLLFVEDHMDYDSNSSVDDYEFAYREFESRRGK